jgi:hypothetical protein
MSDQKTKEVKRAFPYGFSRSDAEKNPRKFVNKLESTIAKKMLKPSKEGSWMEKKKEGYSTLMFKSKVGGQTVKSLGRKNFPAITEGKTRVSQTGANLLANAFGGTPVQHKRKVMNLRAVNSIKRGNMHKAGRQAAKAAIYKNRGG